MSAELEHEGSSPPAKERHSLTLDQRRALRRWANSQPKRPSHKECIAWFQDQYNQTISQSTVSHSLSPKYARLDGDPQLSGSRLRFGNWPDVERLVLLWHQQMVNSGRTPTNDELAEKAKNIFTQLPRYKENSAPEFSPGWIHRFKKRYGLLVRRQRRHSSVPDPSTDIAYLADCVPRIMAVSADTSPAAIRDAIQRVVGVEPSLTTCARVRDEIVHGVGSPRGLTASQAAVAAASSLDPQGHEPGSEVYPPPPDDDPDVVLQTALRALQQEEADAEAEAAAVRDNRGRDTGYLPPLNGAFTGPAYAQQAAAGALATPVAPRGEGGAPGSASSARFGAPGEDLTLTPIQAAGPASSHERPLRCPFCVNQRLLRTIREAVEHMSTHVVV